MQNLDNFLRRGKMNARRCGTNGAERKSGNP